MDAVSKGRPGLATLIVGCLMLGAGLVMIVMPGPGFVVAVVGLVVAILGLSRFTRSRPAHSDPASRI